jgi:hypothetical protein
MISQCGRGLAQSDDFGVGGGIVLRDVPVPALTDDAALMHDHGADGNFALIEGALGAAQGFLHPQLIVDLRWSLGDVQGESGGATIKRRHPQYS